MENRILNPAGTPLAISHPTIRLTHLDICRSASDKQVFPTLDIVGWYSSSSEGPLPEDLGPHAQASLPLPVLDMARRVVQ